MTLAKSPHYLIDVYTYPVLAMAAKLKRLLRALLMTGLILVGSIFTASSVLADGEEDDWEHETICDGFNRLKISWDSAESNGQTAVSGQVSPCNSMNYPDNGSYTYHLTQQVGISIVELTPNQNLFSLFSFSIPTEYFDEESMTAHATWTTSSGQAGQNDDSPRGDDGLPGLSQSLPNAQLVPFAQCIPHAMNDNPNQAPEFVLLADFMTITQSTLPPNTPVNYPNSFASTACMGYPIYVDEISWLDWSSIVRSNLSAHCEIHIHEIKVRTDTNVDTTNPNYSNVVWSQTRVEVVDNLGGASASSCNQGYQGNSYQRDRIHLTFDNLNLNAHSKWNILEASVKIVKHDNMGNLIHSSSSSTIKPIWNNTQSYDYTKYGGEAPATESRREQFPSAYRPNGNNEFDAVIDLVVPGDNIITPPIITGFHNLHADEHDSSVNSLVISQNVNVNSPSFSGEASFIARVSYDHDSPRCRDYSAPGSGGTMVPLSLFWTIDLEFDIWETNQNQPVVSTLILSYSGTQDDIYIDIYKSIYLGAGASENSQESNWTIDYIEADFQWTCRLSPASAIQYSGGATDFDSNNNEQMGMVIH